MACGEKLELAQIVAGGLAQIGAGGLAQIGGREEGG
jgi:hypothetical protein